MASVGVLPALAIVAGAACGLRWDDAAFLAVPACAVALVSWMAWSATASCSDRASTAAVVALLAVAFLCGSAALTADARDRALHTPLRSLLAREFGGFRIDEDRASPRHDPVAIRAVLLEDAARQSDFTTLQVAVTHVVISGNWAPTDGSVALTVGGTTADEHAGEWRAGRTIETFATFRRPARYLDEGVRDFERDLALDGTTLFGTVKSPLVVEVRETAGMLAEVAADIRRHVRRSVDQWIGRHHSLSAAIATAVLIGDRTGLPDDIRLRLQAAGTYHVIAISGGNIAVFTALTLGVLLVCGAGARTAAVGAIAVLASYAYIVTAGASVWRAALMAVLYLCARLLDHRTPPWHAVAAVGAIVVCVRPLELRDIGFLLTFGATIALVETARRAGSFGTRVPALRWLFVSVAASIAVEAALLPIQAWTFSRVTAAGLVLNIAAVPLMAVVQLSALVVCVADRVDAFAALAGWVGHAAATGIVESARLVELAPWLSARVPPPPVSLVVCYYVGLGVACMSRRALRTAGIVAMSVCAVGILRGWGQTAGQQRGEPTLRVTAFDVGQGDATLLQFPNRANLLVDSAGSPFGGGSFDIGGRVLSPALWARGVRALDALVITHGDPDHIGGAPAVVRDFTPRTIWEGVPVTAHGPLRDVLHEAKGGGAWLKQTVAGDVEAIGTVRVRTLHPPPPDWERQRVRNDDSIVLEVIYGDVAVLLLGDVGSGVERSLIRHLTPARIRVLKVAHHGSRTSTSRELVEDWRPQIAFISAGRGNSFGHPAPEVIERLESVGAAIYRTDRDGRITVETDGRRVRVTTYQSSSDAATRPPSPAASHPAALAPAAQMTARAHRIGG